MQMKKLIKLWVCILLLFFTSWIYTFFFFLNTPKIPTPGGITQTENEYWIQQINKHDPHAYMVIVVYVVNAIIIISAIIYTISKVRKMIKNKQTDKTSLDKQ